MSRSTGSSSDDDTSNSAPGQGAPPKPPVPEPKVNFEPIILETKLEPKQPDISYEPLDPIIPDFDHEDLYSLHQEEIFNDQGTFKKSNKTP